MEEEKCRGLIYSALWETSMMLVSVWRPFPLRFLTGALVLWCSGALFFTGCGQREVIEKREALSTWSEITLSTEDNYQAGRIFQKVWKGIEEEEESLSIFKEESEISRINSNAGDWVRVKGEVVDLIEMGLDYGKLSDGAFNIAIGPLTRLYRKAKETGNPPPSEIKRAKELCLLKDLFLDKRNNRVKLGKKGMSLDLGGIAKGYIIDKAVNLLKGEGIKGGMVNIGGDLACFGKKEWRIGVRDPFSNDRIIVSFNVRNKGVATSGDYERNFYLKDKFYHHLISPQSGKSTKKLKSVTIIADTAVKADALSTTVFILGKEKGIELLQKNFPEVRYYIIDYHGELIKD